MMKLLKGTLGVNLNLITVHYVVAQLFFASVKVLQGLQTEVAFLTTRVKAIDEDDWGKLQQVMK